MEHPYDSPFHKGELEAQRLAGESLLADRNSGALQTTIVAGALPFLAQQLQIITAAEDKSGNIWASILFGRPGFLSAAAGGKRLSIHLKDAYPAADDPVLSVLDDDGTLALLALEMATRRRLKINGTVRHDADTLEVSVTESFPLCPKYIPARHLDVGASADPPTSAERHAGTALGDAQTQTVRDADTFYVASTHAERGPDASHRGGHRGFVQVEDGGTLLIPDYPGNGMFNTFGNLQLDQRAGLVIPDFSRRVLLHLTGTAEVLWHLPDTAEVTGGTSRYWRFTPHHWVETALPAGVSTSAATPSKYNPLAL